MPTGSGIWVPAYAGTTITKAAAVNAIDLEVIYQSTLQIARELTLNMLRTGYSTIIKESQDFTFAVFDGAGRMVAQGIPQPLHIGPLASQVNEIRRRFDKAIEPGDAFIVNHPYEACQNHATDITVVSPIFAGQRLLGFIGNIAHKPDLGGKVPGTNSGDATDLFQEGLLIPPLKILRRGEINRDVEALICANTRTPEVTWGDVKAQVNTNTYGLSKFAELFGKYGVDAVLACWSRWMDICETELRKQIARHPTDATVRKPTISTTTAWTSRRHIAFRRRSRSRATRCISSSTATPKRADPSTCGPASRAISSNAW
jgi:N-methylhydantoinase B